MVGCQRRHGTGLSYTGNRGHTHFMDREIIFTSVVIASITSSVITGVFLILSDMARRKHEQKRVLMESAIKLVELYDNKTNKFVDLKIGKVYWKNQSSTFKNFYGYLEEIWKKGKSEKDGFDAPIAD